MFNECLGAMLREFLEPEHFKEASLCSTNIKVEIVFFYLNIIC